MAGKHGGGGHERWLITYADMLTLLLAFFVIMYSISKADAQRFKKFQEGMQQAFHLGVLEGRDAVSTQDTAGAMVGVDSSTAMGPATLPAAVAPAPLPTVAEPAYRATPVIPELQPLVTVTATASPTVAASPVLAASDVNTAQRLQTVLSGVVTSDRQGGVAVELRSEGVVISLYGVLLFDSGTADLQPAGKAVLARIADDVGALPYDIRVEGNTDSIPPDGGPYPSNWELSTARALAVTHFLVDDAHLAPGRLSAAGYAEFRPIAPNLTREGRSRNRRVDLVLVHPQPTPTGGIP